jgi:hypothetical protein
MKNTLTFSILLLLMSCSKRNELLNNEPKNTLRQTCTVEAQPYSCGSYTMLHFTSEAVYDAAYTCLEQEYENYNDAFSNQYAQLNDDDYNDLIDSLGFEEEQTLIDFEVLKNHSSLRNKLHIDEAIWLAAGADTLTYPAGHAVNDVIEQALLSKDGNVRIGNYLIHYAFDGSVIIAANLDCSAFEQAINDPSFTSPNITRIENSDPDCVFKEAKWGFKSYDNSNKRYYWEVRFRNGTSKAYATSVIKNFRKKNGTWKKGAARLYVKVAGQAHSITCDTFSAFSYDEKDKRRRNLNAKRKILYNVKVKRNDVVGFYNANGNNLSYANLTW